MSRKPPLLFALAALSFVPWGPAARAQDRPTRLAFEPRELADTLRSDWYGVYLNGTKIGYFNARREAVGAGQDAGYRESFEGVIKLASFGQKTELVLKQSVEFDASPPYALRGGTSFQADGNIKKTVRLVRTPRGLEFVSGAGADERRRPAPAADYTLADALTVELWLKRGPKVGDRIAHRDFEFETGKADVTRAKVLSEKTSLAKGVKVRYFEVEAVSDRDGIVFTSVYEETGRLLSGRFANVFEMRLESEEQAKNTTYSQDLFVLGMAKVDRKLGDLTKVKSLVLETTGKDAALLEAGPRQAVVAHPSGTVTFKLGKRYGKEVKATPEEVEENLKETDDYPTGHPKVKALAKEAVGDARTPEEKVRRLAKFVHNYIAPSLTVHLPEMHDLMARKKGDCKCYALMFATLARAAGVPAREVSGLMYVGDDQKAFGGHAWNEVVLGGVWVPVDASLGEAEINATHICFGTDTRASRNMLQNLGKLRFRVVEVEHAE